MSRDNDFGDNNKSCCAVAEMEGQVVEIDIDLEKRNRRLQRKIGALTTDIGKLREGLRAKNNKITEKDQEIAMLRRNLRITWDIVLGLHGDKKISDAEFKRTQEEVVRLLKNK